MGRTDNMMIVRGVNIFPSSVEQILHGFPEVVEYRLTARRVGTKDQLLVDVEDRLNRPQRIADELRLRLGLKVNVRTVPSERCSFLEISVLESPFAINSLYRSHEEGLIDRGCSAC